MNLSRRANCRFALRSPPVMHPRHAPKPRRRWSIRGAHVAAIVGNHGTRE